MWKEKDADIYIAKMYCRVYAIEWRDKCDSRDWKPIGIELSYLQCAGGQRNVVL